jgi:hypothetical protein
MNSMHMLLHPDQYFQHKKWKTMDIHRDPYYVLGLKHPKGQPLFTKKGNV